MTIAPQKKFLQWVTKCCEKQNEISLSVECFRFLLFQKVKTHKVLLNWTLFKSRKFHDFRNCSFSSTNRWNLLKNTFKIHVFKQKKSKERTEKSYFRWDYIASNTVLSCRKIASLFFFSESKQSQGSFQTKLIVWKQLQETRKFG